jgi:hypothetical protein
MLSLLVLCESELDAQADRCYSRNATRPAGLLADAPHAWTQGTKPMSFRVATGHTNRRDKPRWLIAGETRPHAPSRHRSPGARLIEHLA